MSKVMIPPDTPGTVFLLHFSQPYRHCRHYTGWTEKPLETKLDRMRERPASPLLQTIKKLGIDWELVASKPGTIQDRDKAKRQGWHRSYCEYCR